MRILVASTYTPLVDGGARKIASDLTAALRERGQEAEQILFPFRSDPQFMLEQMLAIRLTDISDACELLIALRTPIYLLRHPNKVLWFLHHHRGAYDLWRTPFGDIPDTPDGRTVRRALRTADHAAFSEARAIYAISATVAGRLQESNGVDAGVLYPPLREPPVPPESPVPPELPVQPESPEALVPPQAALSPPPTSRYVFFPSRIAGNKRQQLAIESMSHVRSDVRLVVAGAADTPEQLAALETLVRERGLGAKVELIGRWIAEKEKRRLMAGSLATVYVPYQEDYGYVALESLDAGKPLITCTDSGGPLELIADGRQGLIAEPTPQALASAIDRLANDPGATAKMAAAARLRPAELGIGWDVVIETLLR